MAYEAKPDWPFTKDCFGPPCDPVEGWAVTKYPAKGGKRYLHCGWSRRITEEFIKGGDKNCKGYPGGECPHGDKAFEIANQRWIKYFGGAGDNPNSGPFDNDCYNGKYNGKKMMRDRCNGYNCHARQPQDRTAGPPAAAADAVPLHEVIAHLRPRPGGA